MFLYMFFQNKFKYEEKNSRRMHAPKLDRLVISGIYSISLSTVTIKIHNALNLFTHQMWTIKTNLKLRIEVGRSNREVVDKLEDFVILTLLLSY